LYFWPIRDRMYTKEFEIRWNDVDANRHLRNSAYVDYMSHTRMSFLSDNGLGQKEMGIYNLGPVALYEHMYYFREVFPGKPITVSLQLRGIAEDGKYFEFYHNFYDANGKNFARCEMMGGWIDLTQRKLTALPPKIFDIMHSLDKTEDFKLLTKEDTRRFGQRPKDL